MELYMACSDLPIYADKSRNKRIALTRRLAQMTMKSDRRAFIRVEGERDGDVALRLDDVVAVMTAHEGSSIRLTSGLAIHTSASVSHILDIIERGYEQSDKSKGSDSITNFVDEKSENTPRIFAGSLSDEELISFLENVIVELMSRRRLIGKPESLREQAGDAEKKLEATNDFINSIVCRQVQTPNQTL